MDANRIRFIADDLLGAFETLDRKDATYHAMLGLIDILLHVADDPASIRLASRIKAMIDEECGIDDGNAGNLVDGEIPPSVAL